MCARSVRLLSWLLLSVLLAAGLPDAPVRAGAPATANAASAARPADDPPLDPPVPLSVPPVADPHLPSLSLHLAVAPNPIVVGETATLTITVENQAPDPADELLVTLPTPDGALALTGPTTLTPVAGWRWEVGHLNGHSSLTLTAALRIVRMPAGQALVFHAQASARGLDLPVAEIGGALALDRAQGTATVPFTPGAATTLRSGDGRVRVDLPAQASDRPLTLRHGTTPLEGAPVPPVIAGFRRGFGTFYLDATDDQDDAVHTFSQPLTITLSYTPEQLQALGIAEEDLALFWYDPDARIARPDRTSTTGQWLPIATTVDPTAHAASATVDHFSAFALSDGASPSAAFIPSLQGWQVGLSSGAASYSYPIELPAGPAGLKPDLTLTYSSAATDGDTGRRAKNQAGWAGLGWSLDTGAVAANKLPNEQVYYTLVLGGQSYDLLRGAALVANPSTSNPTDWDWRPTDESFIRVRAVANGLSTSTRGGFHWGTAYPRYTWQVWTKDGTRYDFSEDLWWGWQYCQGGSGDYAYMEAYKWALSTVADTHGNTISYQYGRNTATAGETCFHVQGALDRDLWPTTITWAGGRYQVTFVSSARANDTAFEGADNQYAGVNDAPHQTRRLDAIQVQSKQGTSWELVHQYNLGYDYSLTPDLMTCASTCSPNTSYPKLTLRSIAEVANDGTTALPATTFSYGAFGYASQNGTNWVAGGWNRLVSANNGQGGVLTLAYANVGQAANNRLMENQRRVTSRTLDDGQGHAYTWTYSYGTPNVNTLGTTRGPQSPWTYGNYGTQAYPNSAALYYNAFNDVLHDNQTWLAHKALKEFRGHDYVAEVAPDGAQTEHWFYQGAATDACIPTVTSGTITGDACFQRLRDGEFLKGKEYQTRVRASAGGALLQEIRHTFTVAFYDYTAIPLSGLWRAFSAEGQTDAKSYEGGGTPVVRTTRTFYSTSCTADTAQTVAASYGNVGCTLEQDGAALVRKTLRWYGIRDEGATNGVWGRYVVDRQWQEAIYDANGYLLALANQFYDTTTAADATPTIGELWRVARYYDIPPNISSTLNLTLHGSDMTYGYDGYGNRTTETTYIGASTRLYNGTTTTWGAVSGTARTTTTTYDTTFHAFATQVTNPLSQIERADYDQRMGTLIRVTGPNSTGTPTDCRAASYSVPATEETSCAQYDVFGRLVKLVKPGDSTSYPTVQATSYDGEQPFRYRVDQRETPGGAGVRVSQTFYDGLGRTIQAKQEGPDAWQNIVVDTRYDGLNRVSAQSQARYSSETSTTFWQYTAPGSPLYRAITTSYDALGRALVVTAPDGTTTQTSYGVDGDGLWTKTIDANGHVTIAWTDVFGRRRIVREYSGTSSPRTLDSTTTYQYDALDQLTRVTDTLGNITALTYDSLGRKTGMTDPDMGAWSYAYDPTGNLTRQTDAKGQTIWFGYDNLNRVTAKRVGSATGSLLASYGYDTGTNGVGQRTAMSVPNGASTTWTYDARGRKTGATHTVPGLNDTRAFAWAYDSADRLTTLTYPAVGGVTEQVTYAYDAAGRPTQVCSNRTNQPCYVSGATYTALDQPDGWTLGNNLPVDWGYSSPMQRLAQLKIGAGTPASIFDRAYTYDAAGNVATIANHRSGVTQTFAYDDRDRVIIWTEGAGSQSYRYDALGNLTSKAGVGYQYGANLNGTGAGPHQARSVGGQAYSYDANGNMLSGDGRTYAWDAENHPTSITSGGVTESYSYDADGERVTQTCGGTTTIELEGLWEEVAGGATTLYYSFHDQLVAMRESGTNAVTYLHADHLGGISVATNASGEVMSAQEFDPWGQVRPGGGTISQTTRNYTGQQLDGTGLLFYHARYYDPALGRFVSADSLVPEVKNPQAWNRYSYVKNNPLRYTDPTGHCIWDACIVEGAAVVALATAAVYVGFQVWNAMDPPGGKNAPQPAVWSSDTGGQPAEPTPPPYDPKDSKVKGARAEALLSKHLRIGKNMRLFRVDIESETGTRSIRVQPNFVDFKRGFVAESQNTDHLLFTQRIRAILQVAKENGLRFDLYVRKNSTINSTELQRLIDSGKINLIRFFE